MDCAKVSFDGTSPSIEVPHEYNASVEFIDRHLREGRGDRQALIDENGRYTYAELADRVNRAGNALRDLGVEMETRVMLCLLDAVDFPAAFFGAMKVGAVPIPVNTLLTSRDFDYMLRDSRARVLVVSEPLYEKFAPILEGQPFLRQVVVAGADAHGHLRLADLLQNASPALDPAPTTSDDVAFWLYTSGTTGGPKGAMHLHRDLVYTAATYGVSVLGIEPEDLVFSAAKMFFAYGLGNSLTFPLYVGACTVGLAGRPTPESVMRVLREHQPTIFYGVPTLYGAILADANNNRDSGSQRLRLCVSAGEALPEEVGRRWEERFGAPILDGIGTTEMLHIFLSNRPGDVRYGTTGKAVPGYELRVVGEDGQDVPPGEIGELVVKGGSAAMAYWNKRDKSLASFHGAWTRTGDKYTCDEAGYYHYCGRSDDMLKVSGQWVSPFEVESALVGHDKVLEVAVVGHADEHELVKPKAFVVLKDAADASDALVQELKDYVKGQLAPYKYPRWVEFVEGLPKTATGKIQRFKLRQTP
ncbi:MAG: benzoate-CoA ligase family protein [Gammaproteobacteria bacterium]|nr:benzoate-CoA ligase family protein [Gammaproteobacteria bacterium]NIR84770.1 benzoate-CoA ligase family protein [Gammaproteobacteria bacterium]NIR91266.1 benzoate-CoA ligase family protein [Gammaproteobacteria bacterium]NIU05813.1 benzoate-CoA ligase family protein [Gammaproteobacteria bacterium]NIV52932.1 benzoate-CoA ligase family protein [Gammaproteobacteria bacterium]